MKFSIWQEGYSATGNIATAHKVGQCQGETFEEAAREFGDQKYPDDPYWNREEISVWRCQWYPTEEQARKSFG